MTPREGLHLGVDPVPERLLTQVSPIREDPGSVVSDAISRAHDVVESFINTGPPDAVSQRLSRDVLTAESRTWWADPNLTARGLTFAQDAHDEAIQQLDKVTIGGRDEVTLTSRTGQFRLVIANDADYDVLLNLRLTSDKLGLRPSSLLNKRFPPGITQVPVDATAHASGIFPLDVRLETPDGFAIVSKTIKIRSTEFSSIALGITFGALAFLIFFYVLRAIRKRRRPPAEAEAALT
jgi:hypothetical protein